VRTEELVDHLATDLRPVRRLRPPLVRALGWLAFAAAVIGVAVLIEGFRHDIGTRIRLPHDVAQWVFSVVTGVLAAIAAFTVSLPDRSPRWALLPLPALALWIASLGWGCLADIARLGPESLVLGTSWSCLRFIVGLGLPLTLAMLLSLRHAGPIRPLPVTLLGGLAAAALCSAGLSLFHHLDAAAMVLAWHGGAMLVVVLVSGAMGGRLAFR
jgi:hypothetical protein